MGLASVRGCVRGSRGRGQGVEGVTALTISLSRRSNPAARRMPRKDSLHPRDSANRVAPMTANREGFAGAGELLTAAG